MPEASQAANRVADADAEESSLENARRPGDTEPAQNAALHDNDARLSSRHATTRNIIAAPMAAAVLLVISH